VAVDLYMIELLDEDSPKWDWVLTTILKENWIKVTTENEIHKFLSK